MKNLLIFIFLTASVSSLGQKFMIKGNDTLLYQETIEIRNGDTVHLGACMTFEKMNGKSINFTDGSCLRQGIWILADTMGNYWTGNYRNGNKIGIWKRFNKDDKLLRETEEFSLGKDNYTVKEIDYTSGKPVTLVDRVFLSFFIKNCFLIISLFFGAFFIRVFINSSIYNREKGTHYSPIYFFAAGKVSNNAAHSMLCTFTFWFSNYKQENRRLVIISNTLSVIALGIFFGLLIGFAINGELH